MAQIYDYDLEPCLKCGTTEFLRCEIDLDSLGVPKNTAAVVCANCGSRSEGFNESFAIARWNWLAIRDTATEHPGRGREFRELQAQRAEAMEAVRLLDSRSDELLAELVLTNCRFKAGQFLRLPKRPGFLFQVVQVRAEYSYIAGGYAVATARKFSSTGLELAREELSRELLLGHDVVKPFVRVTRWQNLVRGAACRYSGTAGTVEFVDAEQRIARIVLETGKEVTLRELRKLEVLLPSSPCA